jgi:sugar lactone lactonase YvrE
MKSLWILLPILVSFLVYNLIGRDPPFGLRSQPWNPPPYAHNTTDKFHNILATSKKYFEGKIQQPEAIAFNSKGEIFCSSVTGFIHKVDLEKGIDEAWLFVGGRPLDLAFDKDDNLYVCVSTIGLLKIDGKTKDMTILSSYAEEGGAIRYANGIAIASNGDVYFSDSSHIPPYQRIGPSATKFDTYMAAVSTVVSTSATGRLLKWDAKTKKTSVVLDKLVFANGVALSKNEDFVVVCESGGYKVWRVWLKGPKAGVKESFIEGLFGHPDNIKVTADGFWLAIDSPRLKLLDAIHPYPILKDMILRVSESIFGLFKGPEVADIVKLDENGKIIAHLHDDSGKLSHITSAIEKDNKLYLGTVVNRYIGVFDLSSLKK